MRYVVPNFARGLVDRGAAAKLSDNYAQKCSELENFYITSDNSLLRRPPLRSSGQEVFDTAVQDFHTSGQNLLTLSTVRLTDLENLPESLKRLLWMDSVMGHRLPFAETFDQDGSVFTHEATRKVTIGDTEYDATIHLRATIQRLQAYDRESEELLEDDSYTLATFSHSTTVTYDGQEMSIGAARIAHAASAAQLPAATRLADLGDPTVVAIYQGDNLLSSAHTMPYKPIAAERPSIKTEGTNDPRLRYFPILIDSPLGQTEFMTVDPAQTVVPIDHFDAHPDGGVTFLFAGFRYRWHTVLQCLNGPTLLPDFNEIGHRELKTFIAGQQLSETPRLPIKVLYVPATTKQSDDLEFQYKLSVGAGALAAGQQLVTDVAESGLADSNPLETLIDQKRIRGFTFDVFKELFPILAPITANIQNVIGYYRDEEDGNGYAYPDLKFLVAGTDVNGAGTLVNLYKRDTKQRAVMVQPSVPRAGVKPLNDREYSYRTSPAGAETEVTAEVMPATGFMSEESDVIRFPNRSGQAAGGIGVTLAVYKDYRRFVPGDPGDVNTIFDARRTQNPDGLLYIFYDYDNEDVQGALDNVYALSGFSAAGDHYQSVIMRRAQSAPWRPPVGTTSDFIATLLRSIKYQLSTADNDNTVVSNAEDTFYNDLGDNTPEITDRQGWLLWPFGPDHKLIKNFGTPVYISSLSNTSNDYLSFFNDIGAESISEGTYASKPGDNLRGDGIEFNPSNAVMPRYIAYPTTYAAAVGDLHILPGRTALTTENNIFFSAAGFINEFSDHIGDYFSRVANTPNSAKVLADSGLANTALQLTPRSPQSFIFTNPLGEEDRILSVGGPDASSILIGAEHSIKRITPGTLGGDIQFQNISSAGVTSVLGYDTSMFFGASGKDLLTAQYFREQQGFAVKIMNNETRAIEEADAVVSLIPKHRLLLFSSRESNVLTCVSVGEQRQIKGISKFTLPRDVNVQRMKVIDGDTVGFLLSDGSYAEMNFDTTSDTDYTDSIAAGESRYNSVVTTLPMYTMDAKRFSPGTSMTIRELFLYMYGYIDTTVSILNDDTGVHETFDIRHPERDDATELRLFSGIYPYKAVPSNGAVAPRLRIEKNDNRYLSLSSLVAEVQ